MYKNPGGTAPLLPAVDAHAHYVALFGRNKAKKVFCYSLKSIYLI